MGKVLYSTYSFDPDRSRHRKARLLRILHIVNVVLSFIGIICFAVCWGNIGKQTLVPACGVILCVFTFGCSIASLFTISTSLGKLGPRHLTFKTITCLYLAISITLFACGFISLFSKNTIRQYWLTHWEEFEKQLRVVEDSDFEKHISFYMLCSTTAFAMGLLLAFICAYGFGFFPKESRTNDLWFGVHVCIIYVSIFVVVFSGISLRSFTIPDQQNHTEEYMTGTIDLTVPNKTNSLVQLQTALTKHLFKSDPSDFGTITCTSEVPSNESKTVEDVKCTVSTIPFPSRIPFKDDGTVKGSSIGLLIASIIGLVLALAAVIFFIVHLIKTRKQQSAMAEITSNCLLFQTVVLFIFFFGSFAGAVLIICFTGHPTKPYLDPDNNSVTRNRRLSSDLNPEDFTYTDTILSNINVSKTLYRSMSTHYEKLIRESFNQYIKYYDDAYSGDNDSGEGYPDFFGTMVSKAYLTDSLPLVTSSFLLSCLCLAAAIVDIILICIERKRKKEDRTVFNRDSGRGEPELIDTDSPAPIEPSSEDDSGDDSPFTENEKEELKSNQGPSGEDNSQKSESSVNEKDDDSELESTSDSDIPLNRSLLHSRNKPQSKPLSTPIQTQPRSSHHTQNPLATPNAEDDKVSLSSRSTPRTPKSKARGIVSNPGKPSISSQHPDPDEKVETVSQVSMRRVPKTKVSQRAPKAKQAAQK